MKFPFRSLPLLLLLASGCEGPRPDAPVRDVRPTQWVRDEKITVEMARPLLIVGAPTTVIFEQINVHGLDSKKDLPLTVNARAVSPTRALFDADKALEEQMGGHRMVSTLVTIQQVIDGGKTVHRYSSDTRDLMKLDIFPHSLAGVANHLADRWTGGALWSWLGFTVKEQQNGGVLVGGVVARPDREALFKRWEVPPVDGKITREEARVGEKDGMAAAEFDRFDVNHDNIIEGYDFEKLADEDGLAAKAGLRDGDLIVGANGRPVARVADLTRAWSDDVTEVKLAIKRAGGDATISMPRYGKPFEIPPWIIFALCMAMAAGIIALPVPVIGGLVVVWERKISAYMQVRIGPNRVGPNGWLQWLADGLKLIMKEDLVPTEADPYLFKASPYLAFVGLFLVFMVLPFTQWICVADLNIGLLFMLSATSLIVVSIIMGGWSSNSKWSLLGGMRSAAQIISYELPASVSLLSIAVLTGSLSTEAIVSGQGGAPWNWYLFRNPFTFVAFFIYFISALAEGNRTPFDLPEAESELVSGYNTEYSGFRFSLFPLVEWVNLFVIGTVGGMLFLGGWRIPLVSLATQDSSGWWQLAGFMVFLAKILSIIFVTIWIRWTLPRFRVDQMMNLCWKYFIPISFACFMGTLAWTWLMPSYVQQWSPVAWFLLFGVVPTVLFLRRVRYNRSTFKALNLQTSLFAKAK